MGLDSLDQSLNMDIEFEEYIDQAEDCDVSFNNLNSIIGHIEDIVISENFQVSIENYFNLESLYLVSFHFFSRQFKRIF